MWLSMKVRRIIAVGSRQRPQVDVSHQRRHFFKKACQNTESCLRGELSQAHSSSLKMHENRLEVSCSCLTLWSCNWLFSDWLLRSSWHSVTTVNSSQIDGWFGPQAVYFALEAIFCRHGPKKHIRKKFLPWQQKWSHQKTSPSKTEPH